MVDSLIDFKGLEKVSPSIIMVAGVGGGGSNAVNHMFDLGIAEVTFMVCNTDKQALLRSQVPIKVKLGEQLTEGLGAGNNPERGRQAALESIDNIVQIFKDEGTKMVFITAGMGGGTGTGAAPIIAKAAKELGILTVAIVTLPFKAEGRKRTEHAVKGVEELRQNVDSLLVINNENIQEIYGKLTLTEAFGKADDILASAAKGIAEIITGDGVVNVDFADVKTVMSDSGIALMGSGRAGGPDRARTVADMALSSPLLNHNYITGAKNILINITSGQDEIRLEETSEIIEYIQERADNAADIIWGAGHNPALGTDVEVTIIATGFDMLSPVEQTLRSENGQNPADDEQEAAFQSAYGLEPQNKKRWTPPSQTQQPQHEPQPNPFVPRSRAAGVGAQQNPGEQHSAKGIVPPVQAKHVVQERVVEVSGEQKYKDLDYKMNVPAYIRRKVQLSKDVSDDSQAAKVTLKEETEKKSYDKNDGSLFD